MNERIAYRHEVADWGFRQARRSLERGRTEEALAWHSVAGQAFSTSCNPLASVELERGLLEIAARLPVFEWRRAAHGPSRWLHVIDRALPYGGHTAMARRWIASDSGYGNVHSVALTSQDMPVPESLGEAVAASGGTIAVAEPGSSFLARAEWLRRLAFTHADFVVLHIDGHNVVAPVAFGVDGGPPVMLVNHAAHLFWYGGAVSDLVLNCRGSQLERMWTQRYRAIPRCATLPVPIPAPEAGEARADARRRLGIPMDAPVLLSVGSGYKYASLGTLDFVATAQAILQGSPNAWMVIAGVRPTARWRQASAAVGGRLLVVGRQMDLRPYHAAADVYLEGFPFGSTTALLESGARGIAAVLGPAESPPPFTTDGVAVDEILTRPASVAEYVNHAKQLIDDAGKRERCGHALAASVLEHHTGQGWRRHLAEAVRQLPAEHRVYEHGHPQSPPKETERVWIHFLTNTERDPLVGPFRLALQYGLRPVVDARLRQASRNARQVRGVPALPLALLGLALPLRLWLFDKLIPVLGAATRALRLLRNPVRLAGYFKGWRTALRGT